MGTINIVENRDFGTPRREFYAGFRSMGRGAGRPAMTT
jgi:hypothetical protein